MAKLAGGLLGIAVGAAVAAVPSGTAAAVTREIGTVPPANPATECVPQAANEGWAPQAGLIKALDICRAREGIGPLVLPSNWPLLDPAQQLFTATNLERVDRGERPITGLSRRLDADAKKAAVARTDPSTAMQDYWWGVWIGDGIPLADVWIWTYNDGPGSNNLACTPKDHSGCWGHRDALLAHYEPGAKLVAGAGCSGESCAMLIVASNTPTWFTWADELKYFARPPAEKPL